MLRRARLPLIAVAVAFLTAACGGGPPGLNDSACENSDSLVILFTGDVLLDRGVRRAAEHRGWDWLFAGVDSLFHAADATVVNLECPLTETNTPLGKQFIFRADTCTASALHRAGVTHATLANNHTNDQGFQGLRSTAASLCRAGITPMGYGSDMEQRLAPTLVSKGRLTADLFCAVLFPLENWPSDPHDIAPCQTTAARLAEAIRRHRAAHPDHRIVCVLHWGVEFQSRATPQQIRQAQTLIAAGADAIVGHHPHVVQVRRQSDPVPVFYSLGNFVFDQSLPETRRAEMARIIILPDTLCAEAIPVSIVRCRPVCPVDGLQSPPRCF